MVSAWPPRGPLVVEAAAVPSRRQLSHDASGDLDSYSSSVSFITHVPSRRASTPVTPQRTQATPGRRYHAISPRCVSDAREGNLLNKASKCPQGVMCVYLRRRGQNRPPPRTRPRASHRAPAGALHASRGAALSESIRVTTNKRSERGAADLCRLYPSLSESRWEPRYKTTRRHALKPHGAA